VLVQRVLVPGSGRESWTLLGDDGEVVEPAERYLAYLSAIERSPNTVRAYAVSLKLWFEFLQHAAVSWDEAGAEDVARFVGWLRAPADNVIVLADGNGARRPATVNRYLAGVFGFYDHHARTGVQVAAGLVAWRRISRGSYKPFLHHVTKGRPIPVRPVKLHVPRQAPRILEPGQIVAILAAPIRATTVKRAYGSGPVATCFRPGWADCSSGSSSQVPGSSRRAARVKLERPAAAQRRGRTSLTPASGGRSSRARKGGWLRLDCQGSRAGSRRVAGGVASQAPIRRRPGVRAAAMTICPGPGCSVM
jgi:integrase